MMTNFAPKSQSFTQRHSYQAMPNTIWLAIVGIQLCEDRSVELPAEGCRG
jgi:hypothetical protein